jgi:hypothetical protein
MSAGAVADSFWGLVPAFEGLAVEESLKIIGGKWPGVKGGCGEAASFEEDATSHDGWLRQFQKKFMRAVCSYSNGKNEFRQQECPRYTAGISGTRRLEFAVKTPVVRGR